MSNGSKSEINKKRPTTRAAREASRVKEGRGRPKSKRPRAAQIAARCTPEQKREIERRAAADAETVSQYLVRRALE